MSGFLLQNPEMVINTYYAAFHILNFNIGFQALMLPVAFAFLGWYVS